MFKDSDRLKKMSLAILLIVATSLIIYNNALFNAIKLPTDAYYHLSRIKNLDSNYLEFLYPQNFQTLGHVGLATNIFYPALTLQFFVNLIPHFFSFLQSYKVIIILINITSGLVAYFTFYKGFKIKYAYSLPLAIIWQTLATHNVSSLAEELARISFPLLVLGLERIRQEHSFDSIFLIVTALSIAAYSHILTFAFMCLFTGIYFFCILITSSSKIKLLKTMISTVFISGLTTSASLLPIIIVEKLNNVSLPTASSNQFQTWSTDLTNLFFDNVKAEEISAIIILLFITTIIIILSHISIGQIIGLTIALAGTNVFAWTTWAQQTPLIHLQFTKRFFFWGILIAFIFTIVDFNNNSTNNLKFSSKRIHFILTTLAITSVLLMATEERKILFPDVNTDGSLNIATNESINQYIKQKNDGYFIANLGAFNNQAVTQSDFWSLMNYSDYIPTDAISHNYTSYDAIYNSAAMLRKDKKGNKLVNHIVTSTNKNDIKTKNFNATTDKISFNLDINHTISKEKISLPVVYYETLNTKVFISGKLVNSYNSNGLITIKNYKSINKNDQIVIQQYIPNWLSLLYIVSLSSYLIILITYFFYKKN